MVARGLRTSLRGLTRYARSAKKSRDASTMMQVYSRAAQCAPHCAFTWSSRERHAVMHLFLCHFFDGLLGVTVLGSAATMSSSARLRLALSLSARSRAIICW